MALRPIIVPLDWYFVFSDVLTVFIKLKTFEFLASVSLSYVTEKKGSMEAKPFTETTMIVVFSRNGGGTVRKELAALISLTRCFWKKITLIALVDKLNDLTLWR